MNLQDYKEQKVIRIFKPLLKFATDNNWPDQDRKQLERLYQKSLKSCATESTLTQSTVTQFFKKKK